jgi:hypothetical protein
VFSEMIYHASHLRYMERRRTNYLGLLGADQRVMRGDDVLIEARGQVAFV